MMMFMLQCATVTSVLLSFLTQRHTIRNYSKHCLSVSMASRRTSEQTIKTQFVCAHLFIMAFSLKMSKMKKFNLVEFY